jgi:hypothetical protein
MKTRSQTLMINQQYIEETEHIRYEVNIDFDLASQEWNKNKRRNGQMYTYICGKLCKNGLPCKNSRSNSFTNEFCKIHSKK